MNSIFLKTRSWLPRLLGALFTSLFLQIIGYAQLTENQQTKIDSLKHVIATAEHDSVIINSWIAWDEIIYVFDPKLDWELNKKIVERCQELLEKTPQNYRDDEIHFYQKSLGNALNNIGIIYMNKGDYQKAMEYFSQSLKIREEMGNNSGIASSLSNIGTIYKNQGRYDKSLEYYFKSLRISEKLGNKSGIANSLNNIGYVYMNQGDYNRSIANYSKSLKIREEMGDKSGAAIPLNNIGMVY
ncbi:MAG: tetratricopeptide repeat protein, partial [Bacteroidota bacterium]